MKLDKKVIAILVGLVLSGVAAVTGVELRDYVCGNQVQL